MLPERTCAGMIPDTEPEPATATDAVVHRMLAAGLNEGLPEAVSYRVGPSGVDVHLMGAADSDRWQAWWTRHGAGPWTVRDVRSASAVDSGEENTFRYRAADWRCRRVELCYIEHAPKAVAAA